MRLITETTMTEGRSIPMEEEEEVEEEEVEEITKTNKNIRGKITIKRKIDLNNNLTLI